MTTPEDVAGPLDPALDAFAPLAAPLDEDAGPATFFQEINERRARVENAELLHHLRGL